MENSNWRDEVVGALYSIYQGEDLTHGLDHAFEVEKLVIKIAEETDLCDHDQNIMVLQAAALLHDTGYTRADENWSIGKVEHIRESIIISIEILSRISPFKEEPSLLQAVCYLIFKHDDTNYSFPIQQNGYSKLSEPHKFEKLFDWSTISCIDSESLLLMIKILREADALLGTGDEGAIRTWTYSLNRSLPPVSNGSPLSSFAWEESAMGNVRLAAKRALVDAKTHFGRTIATNGYRKTEEFIANICERNGITYESEPGLETGGIDKLETEPNKECHVLGYRNWSSLVNTLRCSPLQGDHTLLPYAGANINSRLIPIDNISPLSRYVLRIQTQFHQKIFQSLFNNYALDIFNLSGIIEFNLDGKLIKLSPPIVEHYQEERGELTGDIFALVDGLHRCYTARKLGLTHIRVVLISDIAPQFPLVPLPLHWSDVSIVDEVPPLSKKRKFRFETIQDLMFHFDRYPKVYSNSPLPSDKDNAKYYTYRDLSTIGSDGIRMVTKK